MHNGIMLNPRAIEAIENLQKNSKKFVFLSNAPRPSANVIDFLLKMKMDKKYLSNVMTSGEAAMHAINKEKFGSIPTEFTESSINKFASINDLENIFLFVFKKDGCIIVSKSIGTGKFL